MSNSIKTAHLDFKSKCLAVIVFYKMRNESNFPTEAEL